MRWRIYYGDDSTFSDRDGAPWQAPAVDVQFIIMERFGNPDHPFKVMTGSGSYCWSADYGWKSTDEIGMYDYLFFYKGIRTVLFGRTMRDELWQEMGRKARREGLG